METKYHLYVAVYVMSIIGLVIASVPNDTIEPNNILSVRIDHQDPDKSTEAHNSSSLHSKSLAKIELTSTDSTGKTDNDILDTPKAQDIYNLIPVLEATEQLEPNNNTGRDDNGSSTPISYSKVEDGSGDMMSSSTVVVEPELSFGQGWPLQQSQYNPVPFNPSTENQAPQYPVFTHQGSYSDLPFGVYPRNENHQNTYTTNNHGIANIGNVEPIFALNDNPMIPQPQFSRFGSRSKPIRASGSIVDDDENTVNQQTNQFYPAPVPQNDPNLQYNVVTTQQWDPQRFIPPTPQMAKKCREDLYKKRREDWVMQNTRPADCTARRYVSQIPALFEEFDEPEEMDEPIIRENPVLRDDHPHLTSSDVEEETPERVIAEPALPRTGSRSASKGTDPNASCSIKLIRTHSEPALRNPNKFSLSEFFSSFQIRSESPIVYRAGSSRLGRQSLVLLLAIFTIAILVDNAQSDISNLV